MTEIHKNNFIDSLTSILSSRYKEVNCIPKVTLILGQNILHSYVFKVTDDSRTYDLMELRPSSHTESIYILEYNGFTVTSISFEKEIEESTYLEIFRSFERALLRSLESTHAKIYSMLFYEEKILNDITFIAEGF